MIPLKLQLKNFLSYGPSLQTIDFGPYTLICLCGKNGHGKSALLDALTWSLWGQARKTIGTARADAQLLHLGQSHMMVILDFEFNEQHYRVKREYANSYGKPYAALEFGVVDPATDLFRPLTDKTIRSTQAAIETLLGLDFESFVNSAFLRQGQANEFSKKSPKERKEILANILSLGQFEEIRKRAGEKIKQAVMAQQQMTHVQERIEQELAHKSTVEQDLATVVQKLKQCTTEEKSHQKIQDDLTAQMKKITTRCQERDLLQFKLTHEQNQEHQYQEKFRALYTAWRTTHKKMLALPDSTTLEQKKSTLITTLTHHQALLQKSLELKELYLKQKEHQQTLVAQINAHHQKALTTHQLTIERLQAEYATKKTMLEHNTKRRSALATEHKDHRQEMHTLEKTIAALTIKTRASSPLETQFEKRKLFYHRWVAQANLTKSELDALAQRSHLVSDTQNPSCPLCEQNLSASRKRFLKEKCIKQEQLLTHRLNRFTMLLKKLKQLLIDQHTYLEELKKYQQEYHNHGLALEHKQKSLEKIQQSLQEIDQHNQLFEQELQTLERSLISHKQMYTRELARNEELFKNNAPYKQVCDALDLLAKQLATLAYNADAHAQTKRELEQVEQELRHYQTIKDQVALQASRKQEIQDLIAHLKKIKQTKQKVFKELSAFADLEHQQAHLIYQEKQLQEQMTTVSDLKQELLERKGQLEHHKLKLEQAHQEYQNNKKTIAQWATTLEDYQTIAAAMGKDGIQALLIEDALPEIENEANALLAELTDNQAHIIIDSLKDLKKGGTKETLDIKISDPAGIRPYELFSGGEAFRIDFAIRIAISKLLARRAGTSLQTLIIDEGFGSQDDEGLARIMDALHKIQDNFRKIIVVSHLAWMKDQFPVHFFVEKGPQGSQVRMYEQG